MQLLRTLLTNFRRNAFSPVDIASLIFFRIAFGLLMAWDIWTYYNRGWVAHDWLQPRLLFKYYGFTWVHPWPGNGLFIHWAALGILAFFIATGFLYRWSTVLFCLGYTYCFLLNEARWFNHTYLICLFSFLLIFAPANRAFSIDALLKPEIRSQTTPAWPLWLLRFQMGAVYFFAGFAKITPDWLRGEPMRTWLAEKTELPLIGQFFREQWMVYAFSYGALLFDLFIVPFLIWRRTRLVAFCVALVFHFLNAQLFPIDIFPWLAIVATTVFFPPDWPRRILARCGNDDVSPQNSGDAAPSSARQTVTLTLILIYAAVQIVVPLRHFLYRGGVEWWYSEHRFSWRMMIQRRQVRAYFYVTDPNSDNTTQVEAHDYLEGWQVEKMGWRPDMLLQFAHYLATVMPRAGPKPLKVEARVLVSLNGRKPQLIIDPNVDLAGESRTFGRPRWLLEIHEPLPRALADPLTDVFAPTFQ